MLPQKSISLGKWTLSEFIVKDIKKPNPSSSSNMKHKLWNYNKSMKTTFLSRKTLNSELRTYLWIHIMYEELDIDWLNPCQVSIWCTIVEATKSQS